MAGEKGWLCQLASPVEVLLLDANGHLTVHNELDDSVMYEHRKLPDEVESKTPETSIPRRT